MNYPTNGLPNDKLMDVAVLLSITTGRLLILPFDVLHKEIEWFVNAPVFSHSIKRVADEITPYLLQWYPCLDADVTEVNKENWQEFVVVFKAKHGDELLVAPIPQDDHTEKNPFDELIEMGLDPDKIIPVDLTQDSEDISPYGDLP